MYITQRHQIQELIYDEIAVNLNTQRRGTIVLYHGWGSNVERQHFRGKILAGFGYRVLIPEMVHHGERGCCAYDKAESTLYFLETMNHTIEEFNILLQQVITPQQPVFVMGHSLGGLIALGCNHTYGKRLSGIAALNSSALWPEDWTQMMQSIFSDANQFDFSFLKEHIELIESIQDKNPGHWDSRNVASVLLTNGALDQTIPAIYNTQFVKEHDNLSIKHVIIPDAGHVVTDGVLALCIDFFEDCAKQLSGMVRK